MTEKTRSLCAFSCDYLNLINLPPQRYRYMAGAPPSPPPPTSSPLPLHSRPCVYINRLTRPCHTNISMLHYGSTLWRMCVSVCACVCELFERVSFYHILVVDVAWVSLPRAWSHPYRLRPNATFPAVESSRRRCVLPRVVHPPHIHKRFLLVVYATNQD